MTSLFQQALLEVGEEIGDLAGCGADGLQTGPKDVEEGGEGEAEGYQADYYAGQGEGREDCVGDCYAHLGVWDGVGWKWRFYVNVYRMGRNGM